MRQNERQLSINEGGKAYLGETDSLGTLTEALTADVDA